MASNTKIKKPEIAISVRHDIVRLYVTMNDLSSLSGDKCFEHVQSEREQSAWFEGAHLEALRERLAVDSVLAYPNVFSGMGVKCAMFQYFGDSRRFDLHYGEHLSPGQLGVVVRMNEF